MDIVIYFFLLGVIARLCNVELSFPKSLYSALTLFLMIAIGLKGGIALAEHGSLALIPESMVVIQLGIIIPVIAFALLYFAGQLNRENSASLAAHYGSVSIGTYAVAVAVLEARGIEYEAYFPLFVVLLELPAIIVGIALARGKSSLTNAKAMAHEAVFNQGIFVIVGALLIGFLAAEQAPRIMPFFGDLFSGALALFLLEMGMVAASKISELKKNGSFLLAFAIVVPVIGALLGGTIAGLLDMTTGGIVLLAVLGASSSYIAVPAAMRVAVPNANHGMSITSSLGITFPFNVLVGIPAYIAISQWATT